MLIRSKIVEFQLKCDAMFILQCNKICTSFHVMELVSWIGLLMYCPWINVLQRKRMNALKLHVVLHIVLAVYCVWFVFKQDFDEFQWNGNLCREWFARCYFNFLGIYFICTGFNIESNKLEYNSKSVSSNWK